MNNNKMEDHIGRPLSMKDYQPSSTLNEKMTRLPPSNKKEFTIKVGEDAFTVDTGLDYDVTMRAINRLRAKEKFYQTLEERNKFDI